MRTLFLIIAIVSVLFACMSSRNTFVSSDDWNQTTKMEYRFGDASVAPEYHRSYTISITRESITISIDSYGNILLTRNYPNTQERFQEFKDNLAAKGLYKHKKKDNACSGGTCEYIRLYKNDVRYFDGYVYHCEGENGDLFLPDGTSSLFLEQIPDDIKSLIEMSRKNQEES